MQTNTTDYVTFSTIGGGDNSINYHCKRKLLNSTKLKYWIFESEIEWQIATHLCLLLSLSMLYWVLLSIILLLTYLVNQSTQLEFYSVLTGWIQNRVSNCYWYMWTTQTELLEVCSLFFFLMLQNRSLNTRYDKIYISSRSRSRSRNVIGLGTARRGLGGAPARPGPSSLYQM